MNYGLYVAASGVLANMHRQDVFANNLANVETTGFKVDVPGVMQRDPASIERNLGFDHHHPLLDRIGGGVLAAPDFANYGAAELKQTDGVYDVALTSDDTFFTVLAGPADDPVRLTRHGAFTRSPDGHLVTTDGGHRVLDERDAPIVLPEGDPLTIDADGVIRIAGEVTHRLGVTGVSDTRRLVKEGHHLIRWQGPSDPRVPPAFIGARQGFLETSGVDPIRTLMSVQSAGRAAESNARMIQNFDRIMDRAVNTLGRIGAG